MRYRFVLRAQGLIRSERRRPLLPLVISILGLIYLVVQTRRVLAMDNGNQVMQEIAAAIQEGAAAFLNREYTFLGGFVVVVAVIIAVFLAWQTALSFILGAIASGAAGYLGMFIAVRANVRTTAAASKSLDDGLRVAFSSGSIMGMAVVSFSLLGMTILYFLFDGDMRYITGFVSAPVRSPSSPVSAAASIPRPPTWALTSWARSSRASPKTIPRNPAVIADNVGDNVGDVGRYGRRPVRELQRLDHRCRHAGRSRRRWRRHHPALPRRRRGRDRRPDRHLPRACE